MSFLFIVMSDIGLPDFSGQDLGIDLDKGIFVRKGKKTDNDSNDSGNNSMNTNGSGMYKFKNFNLKKTLVLCPKYTNNIYSFNFLYNWGFLNASSEIATL